MENRPATNMLWWAVPFALMVLVAIVAMFVGVEPPHKPPPSSSYDASGDGVRAAYLLLEKLDYNVVQSRRLGDGKVRWLLYPATNKDDSDEDDESRIPRMRSERTFREDVNALDAWVKAGGLLLLADESGEFARALGLGIIVRHDDAEQKLQSQPEARSLMLDSGPSFIESHVQPDRRWPGRGAPLANIFQRAPR